MNNQPDSVVSDISATKKELVAAPFSLFYLGNCAIISVGQKGILP